MKRHSSARAGFFAATAVTMILAGCSGTGVGNPGHPTSTGNVTVQSAPLAGPNAALSDGFAFLDWVLGIAPAFATVSTFTSFQACNDTLTFVDGQGTKISVNGSQNPGVGQGLLTFSPTGTAAMTIGQLDLPAGTVLSEVDITFAVVPAACQGAGYAVRFDPGSGPIEITQNTAFKFLYSPNKTIGATDTITLQFGSIVNAMVKLGPGLNDTSIQTISAGQAK